MPEPVRYPKRLIEAVLPIRQLSRLRAKRSTDDGIDVRNLGLWWSRKPQSQARGILLAALLPDPGESADPSGLTAEILEILREEGLSVDAAGGVEAKRRALSLFCELVADPGPHRATVASALKRVLERLGVANMAALDPFAGGGSIPVEAQRLGLNTIAGEFNPLAVNQLRATLEWSSGLAFEHLDAVARELGEGLREGLSAIERFYVPHPERGVPLGYVCFRELRCEGPSCGRAVPATSKFELDAKRRSGCRVAESGAAGGRVRLELVTDAEHSFAPATVRSGRLLCPVCGFVTPRSSVVRQCSETPPAIQVVAAAYSDGDETLLPLTQAQQAALDELDCWADKTLAERSTWLPIDEWPTTEPRRFSPPLYGFKRFSDCHTAGQRAFLSLVLKALDARRPRGVPVADGLFRGLAALLIARLVERHTTFCRWRADRGGAYELTFAGKSIGMIWDFFQSNPAHPEHAGVRLLDQIVSHVRRCNARLRPSGHVIHGPAQQLPLPDDFVDLLYTDPPYFDAIPYAHLADWSMVWANKILTEGARGGLVSKDREIVVDRPHSKSTSTHDAEYFRRELSIALRRCREVLKPDGIGIIVFAHSSTLAWETLVEGVLSAGFIITASWPVETERAGRLQAQGTASLQSSIHLVVRPREQTDGTLVVDAQGEWREILAELSSRLRTWLPRLVELEIVGADAIFACLGPALEIFSRYSRVEKASGEVVTLKEYLEHVWAAVAKEALSMIFADPETSGLEPDARLTAMWLWTVAAPAAAGAAENEEADAEEDDEEDGKPAGKLAGFVLEFDAARKIAQGLGAKLEEMPGVVEVKGEKARLLPVSERARFLFGGGRSPGPDSRATRGRGRVKQGNLFREIEEVVEEAEQSELGAPGEAKTTLDRIHQAMLLFGAGRSEALRRFLVDDGAGRATGFWKLAQALSALYPKASEEKRWVDGVLARKKSLGF